MSERLFPDRRSFKFLSTLFQQIPIPRLRGSADDRIDPQYLPDLIQLRQEVKVGRFDLIAVINRLTKLTQRILGASGVGVWLFTSDEVFLYAGAGSASNDERLRLEVISKLASACQLSQDLAVRAANRTAIGVGYKVSHPDDTNSLLVEPIQQGQNLAGALAALSDECNAFTQRDVANLRLLADLLGQTLSKAAEAGLQESITLKPAAMLPLIERIIPALERMLENDENVRHTTHGFLHSEPDLERSSAGIATKPFQGSHAAGQEVGATQLRAGARTGDIREPAAPDPAPSLPPREISGPRIGVWAAWKSKTSSLQLMVRQKWERTADLVRNRVTRKLDWAPVGLPTVAIQRVLRYAQASFLRAIEVGNRRVQTLAKFRLSLRAALMAAPVAAVLVVVLAFLILWMRFHGSAQPTASGSQITAIEKPIPLSGVTSDAREGRAAETVRTPALPRVSHMRVTDRATEDTVRSLSRYELTGLRRRAEYGDDSAAFEMAMAYEIGRGVPQHCATAAQWVAKAAGEGNVAAQYNLGLRYRDGDGVALDNDEAVKWLQKAAAHQNSDAQAALGVLIANQARVIPSSQISH